MSCWFILLLYCHIEHKGELKTKKQLWVSCCRNSSFLSTKKWHPTHTLLSNWLIWYLSPYLSLYLLLLRNPSEILIGVSSVLDEIEFLSLELGCSGSFKERSESSRVLLAMHELIDPCLAVVEITIGLEHAFTSIIEWAQANRIHLFTDQRKRAKKSINIWIKQLIWKCIQLKANKNLEHVQIDVDKTHCKLIAVIFF